MVDMSDRPGSDQDPWLTVQQVSEELRIHPATVRGWIRQGRVQAARAGKGYRVRRSEVDRALGAEGSPATDSGSNDTGGSQAAASPRPAPRQMADHIIAVTPAPERRS